MATTRIGTTTVHVIGKCPITGCKNRRRVTIPDAPIVRGQIYTWTDWKIPAPAPYGSVPSQLSKGGPKHTLACAPPSKYLTVNRHAYDQAWARRDRGGRLDLHRPRPVHDHRRGRRRRQRREALHWGVPRRDRPQLRMRLWRRRPWVELGRAVSTRATCVRIVNNW